MEALKKFVERCLEFKYQRITPGAFHKDLVQLLTQRGLAGKYEALERYATYLGLMESIDFNTLWSDLKALFRQAIARLETRGQGQQS